MAIDTLAELLAAHPGQKIQILKTAGFLTTFDYPKSWWRNATDPPAGAVPPSGAGEVPTKATLGAIPFRAAGAGLKLYLAALALHRAGSASNMKGLFLYDRLVHTSGLSGTVATAQTVNSVAITRPDANGENVMLALECYTSLGATAGVTVTASYTNQDGTAGRTTSAIPFVGVDGPGDMVFLPLQSGDRGVRSVETVTLSASTGTAGNFGVTLLRPLHMQPFLAGDLAKVATPHDWLDTALTEIDANACLAMAGMGPANAAQAVLSLTLIEG